MSNAVEFLYNVWRMHPKNRFVCISTKQIRTDDWVDHFIKTGPGLKARIRRKLNEKDWGRNHHVYFCPNAFKQASRTKKEGTQTKWIQADCDESDPRLMEVKPTVAWRTSKGRYAALWLMDKPMNIATAEGVSRHYAYTNDFDKSGWDYPQVLRVPGYPNHKYKDKYISRILWTNWDIKYSVPNIKKEEKKKLGLDKGILEKYQHKIPGNIRSLLKQKYIDKGTDRSKILFRLWHELFKAGVTKEAAIEIIKDSVWNKYKGRFTEEDQLDREAEKTAENFGFDWKEVGKLDYLCLAEVEEKEITFLWSPYIPKNKLTILEGQPGLGKSLLAMKIAADISSGRALPGQKRGKKLRTLVLQAEDALDDTVVPRLRVMGADLRSIFAIPRTFSLGDPEGVDEFAKVINDTGTEFIVIDPLVSYTAGADSNKQHEMSPILDHLTEIADELNVTIVIVRHLRKGGAASAIDEGAGSVRLGAAVRSVFQVKKALNQEDNVRALLHIKCNVAKLGKTIEYEIIEGKYPSVEWGELVEYGWEELAGAASIRGPKSEVKVNIKEYILNCLGDKELEWNEVLDLLDNYNVSASDSTINHARSELRKEGRIDSKSIGRNKKVWFKADDTEK